MKNEDSGLKVYTDVMRDVVNNHLDYGTELKFGLQDCHLRFQAAG